MRWAVVAGLTVCGLGLAGNPTRAQARLGSHREDDEAAKTSPSGAEADTALLRGLLWSLEPAPTEIRVIAIEDLGLLGDPRALNPLAELLVDPNPAVQSAALRSIATIRSPRAEEILTNVARHPTFPERLKLAAVDYVLFQNTNSAIGFLKQVASSVAYPANLQTAARRALADVPPDRLQASP